LETVERLHGIGEEISDFHVAALLLSGLPDSYETLVTALDARPDDELTLEYVKGKLVDEYKRKTEANKDNYKSETALRACDKSKYKSKFNNNSKESASQETRECFYCKKKGHLKKECRSWKAKMAEYKKAEGHKAKTAVEENEDNASENEIAFAASNSNLSKNVWCIDSGATSHMTNNPEFFTTFNNKKKDKIVMANGQHVTSAGVGNGYLNCNVKNEVRKIPVKDVLFVPNLESNLLSVKQLAKQGNTVTFEGENCIISKLNIEVARGSIRNDLYKLDCSERANVAKHEQHENCIHMWHRRLGHRDPEAIRKLCQKQLADGIDIDMCSEIAKCVSCIKGKMQRKSFPKCSEHRTL
jgi:hypothetical protein